MEKILLIALICMIICFGAAAADIPAKADSGTKQSAKPMSFSAQSTIESAKASAVIPIPSQKQAASTIISDSGMNFSKMNMTMYSAVNDFGASGMSVGEIVRFKVPRPGWKLKKIQIVGWSPFNYTTLRYLPDRNFLLEVRDKNTDLLYKFVDTQNLYFASDSPVISGIDIPTLAVTDEFYIVFYDRGGMLIGAEQENGTGNSFLVINGNVKPVNINWLIRALGD